MVEVVERAEVPIDGDADVAAARTKARELARAAAFDAFASAAVTTAASELARNVLVHAGRGTAIIELIRNDDHAGVRMEFRDQGPGIADVARALAGGWSTANSLGLGLSGARRLVDEFAIDTALGRGTTVRVVKWARG